jgi:hypothetical protein
LELAKTIKTDEDFKAISDQVKAQATMKPAAPAAAPAAPQPAAPAVAQGSAK